MGEEWIIEVVGVARDAKYFTIGEDAQPYFYLPLAQHPSAAVTLHVRTAGDPAAALGMVRGQVQSLDARMPITNVLTIRQLFELSPGHVCSLREEALMNSRRAGRALSS